MAQQQIGTIPIRDDTEHRPAPRTGLLWQRDFQLLWFGETVSKFGSAATTIALPLVAILTLHAGAFTVGLLEAATWLPWLLIGLPAGAWVDRFARRPVMQACNIISALLFASVPVAAWIGLLSIPQLLTVAFCAGIAKVFFRTAYQAYLPSVVATDHLREANAKMQGSTSAAEIAGPGIAGGMAQIFGPVAAVFVDALSFLVSAVCLRRVQARESWTAERRQAHGLIRQIGEGLGYTARDPYLRTFTLFGAVGNLALVAVQTLLVIFLIRVVGVGPGPAGFLMASMGVGGVIGAMLSKSVVHRFGTARGMLLCQLYTAPFGLLLPLADKGVRLALFALGAAILAAGIVAGSVIASSFRQSYCPAHMLGRVSAIVSFLVFGAMPVGALIGGTAGSVLGIRNALWALTASLMLPALILAFSPVRGRRDLPARAEQTAG